MNKIKISIIMPVYNAEKFLCETIDSVREQTYKDFELIAINDGSSDSSLAILESYGTTFEKMQIINQENSGVSAARNKGLAVARGQYICFLDSDDVLHKDYLKILYQTVVDSDADLAVCDYNIFYGNTCFTDSAKTDIVDLSDRQFEDLMYSGIGTSLWTKIYKSDLLKKYKILFNENSSYGEDMFFNWKYFIVSQKISYVKTVLYGYRQAVTSTTAKYHKDLYEKYKQEYDLLRKFAKENGVYSEELELSININLLRRVPSFLRMNMRRKATLFNKFSAVKEIANKPEIRKALETAEHNDNSKLFLALKDKNYFKIFLMGVGFEYRFLLSRFIKNILKR